MDQTNNKQDRWYKYNDHHDNTTLVGGHQSNMILFGSKSIRIFLLKIFIVVISISEITAQVAPQNEQIVEDALFEAFMVVDQLSMTETFVNDSDIVTSQRASNDSTNLQLAGEVFEEATKILVNKYGMDFLPIANQVLEARSFQESDDTSTVGRKKRSAFDNLFRSKRSYDDCVASHIKCQTALHSKTRSITGYCNNREVPTIGNGVTPIRRLLGKACYDDGIQAIRTKSVISGYTIPSPRLISNKLHEEGVGPAQRFSPHTNHLHMQIGQFVAHDIIFMPASAAKNIYGGSLDCSSCSSSTSSSSNCAPIPVPKDDKYFKKSCLSLTRALNGQAGFGVRTQINQNTHFLDLSVVYGSSESEAASLRTFSNGKMKTYEGAGYTLPPKDPTNAGCQSEEPFSCFKCGDFRNSLHPALIPIHTIFLKEHNRIADKCKATTAGKSMSDEDIYQLTRKIMIGMWQHIVYSEYLPKYLPDQYLSYFDLKPMKSGVYRKYNPKQNPSLSAEFSGAAFRFGHSQARSDFPRQSATNASIGNYDLGNNIFYADQNYINGGWEPILSGLMKTPAMMTDRYFSYPIRNQMFETRGKNGSGTDLVSVNIMRGRDIGLHPYIAYRSLVGLPRVRTWNDLGLTFTQENINLLKSVYMDPADIDLYTGIVMEEPMNGGQLGPTATFTIAEQFRALKTGDRFFYESQVRGTASFELAEINEIRKSTLAKMLCENTAIAKNVNKNIFDLNSPIVACSSIPEVNINVFIK